MRKSISKLPDLKSHLLAGVFLLVLSVLGMRALFHSGLYTAHDMWHQVARLHHYSQALKDGQLPPTWISQLAMGRGYPLFFFSYHLPWMFGAPFVLMGLSVETVLKGLFFATVLASGLTMYFTALALLKSRWAAVVVAGLYIWAPYHFLTVFVSAAIGTAFQFAVLPLLFLGVFLIFDKRPYFGVLMLGSSVAASILAHALTFIFIMPFLGIFALVLIAMQPSRYRLKKTALVFTGGLLGLLLSSFYLVPFVALSSSIIAKNQGNGFTDIYKSNFVSFSQLVYSKWGYGPIVSNAKDGEISLQVGIAQWVGVAVLTLLSGLALVGRRWWESRNVSARVPILGWLSIGLFLSTIVGMLDISKPAWDLITRAMSLDYPFRLLLLSVFFGSLCVGYAIQAIQIPWVRASLGILMLGVALYTNRNHARVNMYTDVPLSLYIESETTTNTFHEYLPIGANSSLLKDGWAQVVEQPVGLSVGDVVKNTVQTSFVVETSEPTTITLSEFDFPGQQIYVDSGYVKHDSDGSGRIVFAVPAGKHQVLRIHEQTAAQQTGIILTVFGLLLATKFAFAGSKKQ